MCRMAVGAGDIGLVTYGVSGLGVGVSVRRRGDAGGGGGVVVGVGFGVEDFLEGIHG